MMAYGAYGLNYGEEVPSEKIIEVGIKKGKIIQELQEKLKISFSDAFILFINVEQELISQQFRS